MEVRVFLGSGAEFSSFLSLVHLFPCSLLRMLSDLCGVMWKSRVCFSSKKGLFLVVLIISSF